MDERELLHQLDREEPAVGPLVRLRVKHGRTQKDGWACSETTVELVLPLDEGAKAGSALLEGYLREVHRLGAREAHRRNEQDGYA